MGWRNNNRKDIITFTVDKLYFDTIKFDKISVTGTKIEVFAVINTFLEMAEQYKRINDVSS